MTMSHEMKRLLEAMNASTPKKNKLTESAGMSPKSAVRKAVHDLAALYVEGLVEFAEHMHSQDGADWAQSLDESILDYFEQEWDEQEGIFGQLRDAIRAKIRERTTKPTRPTRRSRR